MFYNHISSELINIQAYRVEPGLRLSATVFFAASLYSVPSLDPNAALVTWTEYLSAKH